MKLIKIIILTISIISLIVSIVVATNINKQNEIIFTISDDISEVIYMTWEDDNFIYWGSSQEDIWAKKEKETGNIGIGDEGDLLILEKNSNIGYGMPEGYESEESAVEKYCNDPLWWETGVPEDKLEEYEACVKKYSTELIIQEVQE